MVALWERKKNQSLYLLIKYHLPGNFHSLCLQRAAPTGAIYKAEWTSVLRMMCVFAAGTSFYEPCNDISTLL